ncbi:MAG TPA: prolyl oligopeptidase family serine peptidase [Blastocatellia bacterium]|nr:prolyl oligopeptidase family serine peptidase [Blastocatellia bacterium]
MRRLTCLSIITILVTCAFMPGVSADKKKFTIEQILSPGYPFELVSAKKAERIAWISYERGMRNVYIASAPEFKPVRLTNYNEDDGVDMSTLRISDHGTVLAFVRGHTPNRDGWIANPTADPNGAERAVWAIKTIPGSKPFRLVEGTNPALSPDGKWVLFVKDGQIYRVAVTSQKPILPIDRGEKPLFRIFGNNGNPHWSPDSTKIAFVSNRTDHSFVGVYDLRARKVTYLSPGVDRDTSPTWSPDSKSVAFVRRPGTPFGQQIIEQTAGPNPTGPGNGGNRNGGRGQVPLGTVGQQQAGQPGQGAAQGGGQGRRGQGQGGGERPNAIPGLTTAAFKGGYNLSFWVADAATGQGHEFWHNKPNDRTFVAANNFNIEWAGDNVIFSLEPEEWIRYYSVPVAGDKEEPIVLTPGEGMAEHVGLSSDGRYLYYSTNAGDIDRRHVWKVPTEGGTPVQITKADGIDTYPAVLASGKRVATLNATAVQPQSVAIFSSDGGTPNVIFPTLGKDFPIADEVVPENVTLKAEDGLEFHNQLFLPKDIKPAERRPAMVFVHGGPQRQMLLGWHYLSFYHIFYGLNQYLVSKGYIVISVNYRSGIGYGKKFRTAPNTGARGNAEYQDVLAAGKYLQSRPDVDTSRIGIWGLSYGGVLTSEALARNSDIFSAGVDMAGIHLWGNTIDPQDVSYKSSSISEIDKWKSPVLVIQGDDDRNVNFTQAIGLVQLLRAHNIYHELIVFPDDVHETLLHKRWLIAFNALDNFFDRFLINKKS